MKRLFFFLLFYEVFLTNGQDKFIQHQNKVFEAMSQNWLCIELHRSNPGHYQCDAQHHWVAPVSGSYSFCDLSIFLTEQDINIFDQLVFPEASCLRYLDMIALCDLYFPLYRKSLSANSLHEDYIFLPLLLSGNNQNFHSPDDQSGLWSLDYLTARRQHLRIDTLVDERNGGDFTTHAVTRYLAELNARYDKDHIKTICAYNWGVPFVESYGSIESSNSFFDVLSEDSKIFFKFAAYLKSLIRSTRTNNQLNNCFDIFAQSEPIVFEKQVRIEALVKVLQLDEQQLRQMNAVYTGQFIQPEKNKVPFVMDKVATLKFEALADSVYNWRPPTHPAIIDESDLEDYVISYKVKKGDSLGKIAARYDVSVKQIKSWNKIRGDKISKGQILKIHTRKKVSKPKKPIGISAETIQGAEQAPDAVLTPDPMLLADSLIQAGAYQEAYDYLKTLPKNSGNKSAIESAIKSCEKKLNISATAAAKPPSKSKVTYVVKSGDSLWSIAKKHKGVTEQDIMKWNKCSSNIRPGQKLVIYPKK